SKPSTFATVSCFCFYSQRARRFREGRKGTPNGDRAPYFVTSITSTASIAGQPVLIATEQLFTCARLNCTALRRFRNDHRQEVVLIPSAVPLRPLRNLRVLRVKMPIVPVSRLVCCAEWTRRFRGAKELRMASGRSCRGERST